MRYVLIFLSLFLLVPFVSAEIIFSQPESVYSIGDMFTNSIRVQTTNAVSDFLVIRLVCVGGEVELYRNALSMQAGEIKNVELNTILGNSIVGSAVGDCTLRAKFGNEESQSQVFQLTREINVDLSLSGILYNPGESIFITGTAKKANAENVQGFVEILIDGNNDSISSVVNNGVFSLNYTLPGNMAPGEHIVSTRVFEKDSSNSITNEGNANDEFSVRVILTSLEIETNAESIIPENILTYSLKAYDQSNNIIERDALIKIYRFDDSVFSEQLMNTKDGKELKIEGNFAPGYWKIEATSGDIEAKKLFYIEEFEKIDLQIINGTFVVKNVGNIPYNKFLEIGIGNYSILKEVKLPVGGVKRYRLSAPNDLYEVNIKDGNRTLSAFSVPLTGRVVDIGEINDANFKIWAVGFFFLILLCLGLVTNVYVKKFRQRLGHKTNAPANKQSSEKKLAKYNTNSVVASAYMAGNKENASVIALRTEAENNVIQDAIAQARRAGAQIYEEGEYRIMVFKTKGKNADENESVTNAVKIGKQMHDMIAESNRAAKNKIDFGIGINRGEIMINAKTQMASMGTAVPGAKKLARASQNNVLMSDDSYKRIMGSLKAEKLGDAWKITEVLDRSKYNSFIQGFMKRN